MDGFNLFVWAHTFSYILGLVNHLLKDLCKTGQRKIVSSFFFFTTFILFKIYHAHILISFNPVLKKEGKKK